MQPFSVLSRHLILKNKLQILRILDEDELRYIKPGKNVDFKFTSERFTRNRTSWAFFTAAMQLAKSLSEQFHKRGDI